MNNQPTREQYETAYRNARILSGDRYTISGNERRIEIVTNKAANEAAKLSFGDRRFSDFTGWVNWKRGIQFDQRQRSIDIARILFIDGFYGIAK